MKLLLSLLALFPLAATELRPWFEDPFLPISKVEYSYKTFNRIEQNRSFSPFHSYGNFVTFGLYSSLFDSYSVEVEVDTTETKQQSYSIADGKITGRLLLMDDVSGSDPVSLSAGLTLCLANQAFVRDINCFYHGKWEGIIHLALGKEVSQKAFWTSRSFALLQLGSANQGSMWLSGKVAFEKNSGCHFSGGLFLEGLIGLGSDTLLLGDPFVGYGPIQHRSIDAGCYLYYTGFEAARIKAELRFRPWAVNYPISAGLFLIAIEAPFSL